MIKRALLAVLSYRQAEALKTGLSLLLYYTGFAWLWSRLRPGGATILLYHSVSDRDTYWDNRVSPRRFEEQIAYVAKSYQVVSIERIVDAIRSREPIPRRWVAVTFDDGYRDNLQVATPILMRHGAMATFFVTVNVLEGEQRFFYDEIQTLLERTDKRSLELRLGSRRRRFAWNDAPSRDDAVIRIVLAIRHYPESTRQEILAEVREALGAARSGGAAREDLYLKGTDVETLLERGMSIGSHTLSHPDLSELPEEEMRRELEDSKAFVEARAGRGRVQISYPYGKPGSYDGAVKGATSAAGYDCALTTVPGQVRPGADLFALPRIGVRNGSLTRLKVGLMGIPL